MSTTPIADPLGIDVEKHPVAFRFTFRESVFVWTAPIGGVWETLIAGAATGELGDGFRYWHSDDEPTALPALAAMMIGQDVWPEEPIKVQAILSEARAAIAAQGGAE